ncbi:MAG: hypothetical protein WC884_00490 [Candidatus Paceibacterota bacterium]
MSKTNNNSINYGLKLLTILAFGLIFIPFNRASATTSYVNAYKNPVPVSETTEENNPKPIVSSISPSSINKGLGTKTITISGGGFVPSSTARINGSNRLTTFIDSSHLLIQTNQTDMSRADGFFITVFNNAPGGGYSNAAFFTIKNQAVSTSTNTNNTNNDNSYDTYSETNQIENQNNTNGINGENNTNETDENYSSLASNAIFGTTGFLPSGLIQWVLFAIIILLIIIIVRKIFGAKEDFDTSLMKHA